MSIDPELIKAYADQIASMIEHAEQTSSSACDFETIQAIVLMCHDR